jgi:prolipoprotein diacylglyceryl transferase
VIPTGPAVIHALASMPSPSSREIGPFRVYGLLLALGVLVGLGIGERRCRSRGNRAGAISDIAFWIVVWGVIGARAYHVLSDYELFEGHPERAVEIWRGGLSIWGAVLGGALATIVVTRRRGLDALVVMDCLAPGLLVAQAIGRWGNWFNQELFGRPTSLPWALEISLSHRPPGYLRFATFQPTFLYESLFCLLIAGVLVLAERRGWLRRGQTFAGYVVLYTFARFWFENLRIDPAHHIGPLRLNAWVAIVGFVLGCAWFVRLGRVREPDRESLPNL